MSVHLFGIRHHGPGSARSLRQALEALQPDILLVEGPADKAVADLLPLLNHSEMQPPVALLVYIPDKPKYAVYYPFAIFSPEWQALQYGLSRSIPVRFMDLPQTHQLAFSVKAAEEAEAQAEKAAQNAEEPPENGENEEENPSEEQNQPSDPRQDPFRLLAEAAGYSDHERWWEHMVEHRRDSTELFAAILEVMTNLRKEASPSANSLENQREAYMRRTLREAQKEGFERIAVVCGAWHTPALAEMPSVKEDDALLKGLPKVKVQATWSPWTYGRLSFSSGYGAGIESPGWYQHLFENADRDPTNVTIRWMTKVARLLRAEDLAASSAHVIEAVRLAESLAALRDRPLPGLAELNEATLAVFCFGDNLPMQLIHTKLIISECLGTIPAETPTVPLQQDLQKQQKSLRLKPEVSKHTLELDLRNQTDLERSYLLHRLALLGIPWGKLERNANKAGTFRENWTLQWQPEYIVAVIEASMWGNTVSDAATACVRQKANDTDTLPSLTAIVDHALLANLSAAIDHLMERLQNVAALTSDVLSLMQALPPLIRTIRYGNVRKTDVKIVSRVVDSLVIRICVGLPNACASLNEDAALEMLRYLIEVDEALVVLQNSEHLAAWSELLRKVADQETAAGIIAGRCCWILLRQNTFSSEEAARRMSLALSPANDSIKAAAWLEGFLKDNGIILLHDENLWNVLDDWLTTLANEGFTQILPLLRRTFATFPSAARRQMGEKVKQVSTFGLVKNSENLDLEALFDKNRAESILPIVAKLLGYNEST